MTPTDIQRAFEERQQAGHALRDLATEAKDREFTADETEDGYPLRTLNEVALRDVGPVTFNAYPDASASLRSLAEDRGLDLSVLIEAAEANTLRDLIFPTSDEPEPGDTHSVVRHPGTIR